MMFPFLVVIRRATDIIVILRYVQFLLFRQRSRVQTMLEDGFDALVTATAQQQRPTAGGFEPLVAIGFPKAQDAQARSIALLWVTP